MNDFGHLKSKIKQLEEQLIVKSKENEKLIE
jgi:hypothetical protein